MTPKADSAMLTRGCSHAASGAADGSALGEHHRLPSTRVFRTVNPLANSSPSWEFFQTIIHHQKESREKLPAQTLTVASSGNGLSI